MRNRNAFKSLLLAFAMIFSLFAGATQAYAGVENARAKGGKAYAYGHNKDHKNKGNKGNNGKKVGHAPKFETINLVAINDFHGNVLEGGKNPGIAKVAGVLNQMKEENQTFFYSAGDNFQGTAISNLTHGEVVNEAFKLMDMKASAIGNHEYDWGKNMMDTWSEQGGYPFLASNIVYKDSGEPVSYAEPYMIQEVKLASGKIVKIGFVGIATPETASKTSAENVEDIDFLDPAKAAQKWVDYLKYEEGVDAVVALTHLGGYQDAETGEITGEVADFANNVEGLDVVFSGHYHQTIDGMVNGTQILQAYYNGRSLQVAELTFNTRNTKLTKVDGYVDEIYKRVAELPIDEEVAAKVHEYEVELADILNEVIGKNVKELEHDGYKGLTTLGQWSAKTLAEIGGTQIGLINGGGIREPLPAGDITMGTMYSIFPFDNTLVTMEVTGEHLIRLIEHGIQPGDFRDGQFYGVKVEVDLSKPYGSRITNITLEDGTPIDPAATYTLSSIDFLVGGGDKYDFSGATNVVDTFSPVRDLLADYIREAGVIDYTFDASAYVVK